MSHGNRAGLDWGDFEELLVWLWAVVRVIARFAWRQSIRHPRFASGFVFACFVQARLGLWPLTLAALPLPAVLWTTVAIWWTARHASRVTGFRASVTAWSRVRKVRRRWNVAATRAGLLSRAEKDVPTLAPLWAVGPAGPNVAGVIDLGGAGMTLSDLISACERIQSTMRVVRVRASAGALPSEAILTFEWSDPLREVVSLEKLVSEHGTGSGDYVNVGLSDRAEPATVHARRSMLVCGETGSGKSYLIWAGLAGLQLQGIPTRVRAIDPAGGVELAQLRQAGSWVWTVKCEDKPNGDDIVRWHGASRRILAEANPTGPPPKTLGGGKMTDELIRVCQPCLRRERPMFHVHTYTDRPTGAASAIEEQRDSMNMRMRTMSGSTRLHIPTLDEPLDLLVIDELLLLKEMLKKGVDSPMGEILAVGRKAAHFIWAGSQLSQKDVIGDVRDLFPQRVALALRNRELTDAVLGPGATADGALAHKIDAPGVGYRFMDGVRAYTRFRGVFIPDALLDVIARGEIEDVLFEPDEPVFAALPDEVPDPEPVPSP